jgi:hypothetical protein
MDARYLGDCMIMSVIGLLRRRTFADDPLKEFQILGG